MNSKVKKGIVGGAIVATTFGSIGVSTEVDRDRFIDRAAKGDLYVTEFNKDLYKSHMKKTIIPRIQKEDFTLNELRIFLKSCNREKERDWHFKDFNKKEMILELSRKLDDKFKDTKIIK